MRKSIMAKIILVMIAVAMFVFVNCGDGMSDSTGGMVDEFLGGFASRSEAGGDDGRNTTFIVNGVTFNMVSVAGGTFTMGCTSEQGNDCDSNESPTHSVTLSSFYISKYPVTWAQWAAVTGDITSGCFTSNLSYPVECVVPWHDVQVFIQELNRLSGRTYRLPTEAEWEFAARGGSSSKGYKYSGSNNIDEVAWYGGDGGGNSGFTTHPVGTKQPNELGIFDMSGNVTEWVGDWYGDYTSISKTNPMGPLLGYHRVLRGGSWVSDAGGCRVSSRGFAEPIENNAGIGFRLVRSP
jgi:formylglycine-generating enzyme required for sulfatase activity